MKKATRDGFGEGLLIAAENQEVVALCADLTESVRVDKFAQKHPKRFFQMGICEQNMMSVAAGMSHIGKIPFACSFAVFNPGRNWDQLRVSVCYSKHNVKIVGSHAGVTVGEDGATHQALEDIALTRVLPNLVVLVPCDAVQAKHATVAAAKYKGPVYIRLGREKVETISADEDFLIGKAIVRREGTDVTIVACGVLVQEAMLAADALKKIGISAEVLDYACVKPFDENTLLASVKKTGCVVSAEEHQITGGLGGAVAEVLAANHPTPQEFIGMHDRFGQSGKGAELLTYYGMSAKDIVEAAKKVSSRK